MLQKINSHLALTATVVLFTHMATISSVMLNVIPFLPWFSFIPVTLLWLFIAHAILSASILCLNQSGNKTALYWRFNRSTYIQRFSAILLCVIFHFHMNAFAKYQLVSLMAYIIQLLLVTVICVHVSISVPKAMVGIGWVTHEKSLKRSKTASSAVMVLTGIYCSAGFTVLAFHSGLFGGGL